MGSMFSTLPIGVIGSAGIANGKKKKESVGDVAYTLGKQTSDDSREGVIFANEYGKSISQAQEDAELGKGKNPKVTVSDAEVPTTNGTDTFDYGKQTFKFTPSANYQKAMEYTNQLLSQLSSGRTSYTDQINALMDQINNREEFSYDPNNDTLFQNYLSSMQVAGANAMQDTMGQAAALTGGYDSTYATSAANQAYNNYIQGAYDNLDDYYGMALNQYNAEGDALYNKLGMYQTADDIEYNRLASAYSANAQNAAQMYDNEYNNYWQEASMNNDNYWKNKSYDYQLAKDALSSSDSSKSMKITNDQISNIESAIAIHGAESDEVDNILYNLYQQGYSQDQIDEMMTTAQRQYDAGSTNLEIRLYSNTKAGYKDNVYKDQYGREYTRDELKKLGLLNRIVK